MPRYKLTIAYDGTDFCGWQKQEPYGGEWQSGEVAKWQSEEEEPGRVSKVLGALPVREGEDRPRVAMRTVQEVVERAVREVVREPVVLHGASRTDSGVHARGQVGAFSCGGDEVGSRKSEGGTEEPEARPLTSHFPLPTSEFAPSHRLTASPSQVPPGETPPRGGGWPLSRGTDRLLRAINGKLPDDVMIVACEVVDESFNPVTDCVAKGYSYTLHVGRERVLWDRRYVHQVWEELDVAAMQAAATRFVGEFDFAAFAAAGHGRVSTVRRVFACGVTASPERERGAQGILAGAHGSDGAEAPAAQDQASRRVRIDITGNGFLWNMVRIIAGTLVEVGKGKMQPEDVTKAIESKDRRMAGPTLGPGGLCLEWIRYAESGKAAMQ